MADDFPANFPTSMDSYTTLVDNTDNVVANHPNSRGSAIVALENKVGIDGDADTNTHDYKFTHLPAQAQNWDIGAYSLRAATLIADGLTTGRVVLTTTNGELTTDSDITFATDTLTVTKIAAFELTGKLTAGSTEIEGSAFDIDGGDISAGTISGSLTWSAAQDLNSQALTNVNIDSGNIDGVTIGAASAPTVTNLGTVTTCDINGGAIDGAAIGANSASTGAFTTLKVGSTNQGDILYDNGTSLVRLTPGTSGQYLKTQGAAANPTWDTISPAMSFTDSKSFSNTTSSDAVTLTNGNHYFVSFEVRNHSSSDNPSPVIRISGDAGNNYNVIVRGTDVAGSDNTYATSANSGFPIFVWTSNSTTIGSGALRYVSGFFYIFPHQDSTQITVMGQSVFWHSANNVFFSRFGGNYENTGTSVLFASANAAEITGEFYVYNISLS